MVRNCTGFRKKDGHGRPSITINVYIHVPDYPGMSEAIIDQSHADDFWAQGTGFFRRQPTKGNAVWKLRCEDGLWVTMSFSPDR